MNTALRLALTIGLSALIIDAAAAASYRKLGSDREVTIETRQPSACVDSIGLRIRAPSALFFENEAKRIRRLVGGAKASLQFECDKLERLTVLGLVNDVTYFEAEASRARQWKLVAKPTVLAQALASIESAENNPVDEVTQAATVAQQYRRLPGVTESAPYKRLTELAQTALAQMLGSDQSALPAFFEKTLRSEQSEQSAFKRFDAVESGMKAFSPSELPAFQAARKAVMATALTQAARDKLQLALAQKQPSLSALLKDLHQIIEMSSLAEPVKAEMRQLSTKHIHNAYLLPLEFDAETAWLPELAHSINGSKALRRSTSKAPDSPLKTATVSSINSVLKAGLRRLGQIRSAAQQTINNLEVPYDQIAEVLEVSESIAFEFETNGFSTIAASMRQGAANRIETILARDLPGFKQELTDFPPKHETIVALKLQSESFNDISADVPGFAAYARSIEQRIDAMRPVVCQAHAGELKSRLSQESGQSRFVLSIYQGETLPLDEFVCIAYENGHFIESLHFLRADKRLAMTIHTSNDAKIRYELSSTPDDAGGQLLTGDTLVGDEQTPLSQADWYAQIGNIVRPSFSGEPDANGVTACDRFAADPHDPKRRAEGKAWESESLDLRELEFAIDACIAAVEYRPNDATQVYQLGRLLYLDGSTEEASDFLTQATRRGYAAATHHLANIVINDQKRKDAFYDAVDLYRIAAKKRYAPAIKTMAELEPDGEAIFRPLPSPSGRQLASAFSESECVTNLGVRVCKRVVDAEVKSCFQTKATEFSCEWRPIMRCSTNLSSTHNSILQMGCNDTQFGFGNFRKNRNGSWTFIPG